MKLKLTKEPVTSFACANAAPEPLGGLTWCWAAGGRVTLQDWGAIGELVGGVAVIATLVYLAMQTREGRG